MISPFNKLEERIIVSGGRNAKSGTGYPPERREDLFSFHEADIPFQDMLQNPESLRRFLINNDAFCMYLLNRDDSIFRSARSFYARGSYQNHNDFLEYTNGASRKYLPEAYAIDYAFKMTVNDFLQDNVRGGKETGVSFTVHDVKTLLCEAMSHDIFKKRFKRYKKDGISRFEEGRTYYWIGRMTENETIGLMDPDSTFLVLDMGSLELDRDFSRRNDGRIGDYIYNSVYGCYNFLKKEGDGGFWCRYPSGEIM